MRPKLLLTKAQKIAESKGLTKLALKISDEHDILLDQLDQWEHFTMRLPTIAEKLELTHIEEKLKQMKAWILKLKKKCQQCL